MKIFRVGFFTAVLTCPVVLSAQADKAAAALPPKPAENPALPADADVIQEYVARRAQRIKERDASLAQAAAAKDETERKQILAKLAADESAYQAAIADVAHRAYLAQQARTAALRAPAKK